jgi:catechol-2,3-dioxygenase
MKLQKQMQLKFLDHVAIKVNDLDRSVAWYQNILGLETLHVKEWGAAPVMMLAGESGIALFPNNDSVNEQDFQILTGFFHFAFRCDNDIYEKKKNQLLEAGIQFIEEDHTIFKSIYLSDPDGYKVELTTPV